MAGAFGIDVYTLYLGTEQAIGLKFAQRKIETRSDDIRCYLNFALSAGFLQIQSHIGLNIMKLRL